MTSNASAGPAGYGGGYSAATGGTSWNTAGAASASGYGSTAGAGGYRAADQRGMYGTQDTSPYSSDPSQRGGYSGGNATGGYPTGSYPSGANSGYSQPPASSTSHGTAGYGAATSSYGTPGGAASATLTAPSAATGPWNGYTQPASPYDQRSSTQPATSTSSAINGYNAAPSTATASAQGGYGGYTDSQQGSAAPSPSSPSNSYPALPSSLATDNGSYRPGSTAGSYGVQNAAYNQTSASGTSNAAGAINYGNSYTR
jgi:hypothetical protein